MRLYTLRLSRPVKGLAKGPVGTIPAVGMLADADGRTPCPDAIAACLPASYRKMWARHRGQIARYSTGEDFHWTLRDSKGRVCNTLYATPSLY